MSFRGYRIYGIGMDKKEFEKKFNAERNANFVIVELYGAAFYVDNYFFSGDKNKEISLFWKDAEVGYCKLSNLN